MPTFQITGLPAEPFAHLATLDADALARRGICRVTADSLPGYPCRISLADAEPGAELLLLTWAHHEVNSPYRAAGPVYVRVGAQPRSLAPGEVPDSVRSRLVSVRAYDAQHMMVEAEVVDGTMAAATLAQLFERPDVQYAHVHYARRGCFACEARRVP